MSNGYFNNIFFSIFKFHFSKSIEATNRHNFFAVYTFALNSCSPVQKIRISIHCYRYLPASCRDKRNE